MTTRYEIMLEIGTAVRALGYSARRTRGALSDYVQGAMIDIIAALPNPTTDTGTYHRATGWRYGTNVTVRFTGATERHPSLPPPPLATDNTLRLRCGARSLGLTNSEANARRAAQIGADYLGEVITISRMDGSPVAVYHPAS